MLGTLELIGITKSFSMSQNSNKLLTNVHQDLEAPSQTGASYIIKGLYDYYHYGCDNFMDQGWGCGYRTLQTMCSWIRNVLSVSTSVPTIHEIQQVLVEMEDKPKTFFKSREWIGCVEACLVIDKLYDVPCKIVHVNSGRDLSGHIQEIVEHFETRGTPIMMGGDQDCSSKGIVGVHINKEEIYLLIVDPHFVGIAKSASQLQLNCWVKWQKLTDFIDSSFYNFCLPLLTLK